MGSLPSSPHFAIFPFLSQGHTIPLLHLSRLLHHCSAAVTIFTTAANSPPIRAALLDTDVSVVELPFPQNVEGLPAGVENTKNLPSFSYFIPFLSSMKLMQKSFEDALQSLNPPVSCVISDGFLGFTLESAQKFGVPRLVFYGMGAFSSTMHQVLFRDKPHAAIISPDEPFPINAGFPGLELTRNDFDSPFNEAEPSGPLFEFIKEQQMAMTMSQGIIVNTFYELEQRYVDYWDNKIGPKSFCIGPLCMAAETPPCTEEKPPYVQFLDEKLAEGKPVLYVAFGTQAEVSPEQFREIAEGLERSEVSFLWVLKSSCLPECEEKVRKRGIIVKEWVDQLKILKHEGVKGFLSHCGWNSVLESITASVPILALPFMAEQHLNARFVVEELGVGLRIMPRGGSVRGLLVAEEVERMVRELMSGEKGAEARRKMAECGVAAGDAMKEGGSSMQTLDSLIKEMSVENDIYMSQK